MSAIINKAFDISPRDYNKHVESFIDPYVLQKNILDIQKSNKFKYYNNEWIRNTYEGYAVLSMVNNNPGNRIFLNQIIDLKNQLSEGLENDTFYMLPEESYHQTMANTLSDVRYYRNIRDKNLDVQYPGIVQDAFNDIEKYNSGQPLTMNMIGFSIFGTCVALIGNFRNLEDYERITSFREQFYNNQTLNELDIRWTRPFIGHITISYICDLLDYQKKEKLLKTVNSLNKIIPSMNLEFKISQAELRKYQNLAEFKSPGFLPTFYF